MARPNGVFKRQPDLGGELQIQWRFEAITKAQWAEVYRDLYAATQGEDRVDTFMDDAEARLATLQANGLAGG